MVASRPDLEVTLVEAQERKWSFLMTACRKASLSCRCLNARFGAKLPPGFPEGCDLVSCRGVRLSVREMEALAGRLAPGGGILLWRGAADGRLPAAWLTGSSVPIPGSSRKILRVAPG